MARIVLVLGVRCSGASVVAGLLEQLGVHMGDRYRPKHTKWDEYEDAELNALNIMAIYDDWMSTESMGNAYARYKRLRSLDHEVWGAKDPLLIDSLPYMCADETEVCAIVCNRPFDKVVESLVTECYLTGRSARNLYLESVDTLCQHLRALQVPVLEYDFEDTFRDSEAAIAKLSAFVFEGREPPSQRQIGNALATLKAPDASLVGWGDICVGPRVYRVPELDFFNSWTGMLTGGLKRDDIVLIPEDSLTGHRAANKIAHAFMRSGCDSLLFLDDDMLFGAKALHNLRSNQENWKYDVVSAFTTRRTWPPLPLLLELVKEQPDDAEVQGSYYKTLYEWDDSAVIPRDAVGLAFTLVKRHVFNALTDIKWGVGGTDYFSGGKGKQGPDIVFSERCRALGFKIAVDTSVKIEHVGRFPMGYEQYQNWHAQRENANREND